MNAVIAPDYRLCHIYGLFVNDRCIYVGQTRLPEKRSACHRNRFIEILGGVEPQFKVFAVVLPDIADQFEAAEIHSRKQIGEAEFNLARKVKTSKASRYGDELYCVETGEIFDSQNHLAANLGVGGGTVGNIFKKYGGKYSGFTFIKMSKMSDAEYDAAYDRMPTGRSVFSESRGDQ